jgi:hypothetical protein
MLWELVFAETVSAGEFNTADLSGTTDERRVKKELYIKPNPDCGAESVSAILLPESNG